MQSIHNDVIIITQRKWKDIASIIYMGYLMKKMCKNNLTKEELAAMIDISAVQTVSDRYVVDEVVKAAKEHKFICAFAMPNLTAYLKNELKGSGVRIGGTIGFPSGADSMNIKVRTAKELAEIGCDELDMVIAVNLLKSGMYDNVLEEIRRVRDIAGNRIFKTILEVNYLTDDEIKKACELAVLGGVDFVKSATGWSGATKVEQIRIMKSVVGNDAKVKAAGGIGTLETIYEMMDAGCERFGISCRSAEKIMKEFENK